jgi:flagellar biogenesis protein FliO
VLLQMNQKEKKPLTAGWRDWWRARLVRRRQLRLTETLGLGEHRFVAVIEFERRRFLLGGTARSLTLLTELAAAVPDQTTVNLEVEAQAQAQAQAEGKAVARVKTDGAANSSPVREALP